MADQSPADHARQYSLKVLLEQSEGWKYVLAEVFRLLQHYDYYCNRVMSGTAEVRADAQSRKAMLLELIQSLYKDADVESPFARHYAALIAGFRPTLPGAPPPAQQTAETHQAPPSHELLERRSARRSSGSVA